MLGNRGRREQVEWVRGWLVLSGHCKDIAWLPPSQQVKHRAGQMMVRGEEGR